MIFTCFKQPAGIEREGFVNRHQLPLKRANDDVLDARVLRARGGLRPARVIRLIQRLALLILKSVRPDVAGSP